MSAAKITSKGQITLPKEVRDALDLRPGDRVTFVVRDDRTVVMVAQKLDMQALFGRVHPPIQGVSLADMEDAIGRGSTE